MEQENYKAKHNGKESLKLEVKTISFTRDCEISDYLTISGKYMSFSLIRFISSL